MMLEIGVFTNAYGAHGVRAAIEGASKAGLKHVEIAMKAHDQGGLIVSEGAVITEKTSMEEIDQVREWMKELNVSPTTSNGGADMSTQEGVDIMKARLDRANRLGSKYFVISVGQELDDNVAGNIRTVGGYAEKLGIKLALETHPPLVTNADVGIATIKKINHPNVGINFDSANMYYYTDGIDAAAELEKMIDYVTHVHLKDSNMGFKEWHFPAIGDGKIPVKRMIETLNKAGYNGPLSLEIEGIQGEGPLTFDEYHDRIVRSAKYLRENGLAI